MPAVCRGFGCSSRRTDRECFTEAPLHFAWVEKYLNLLGTRQAGSAVLLFLDLWEVNDYVHNDRGRY